MKRGSASFEQWVNRATDDEEHEDHQALTDLEDRADQERKGE